jgi:hypothetical protein
VLAAAGVMLAAVAAVVAAPVLVPAPASARKLLELSGDGVQIYACAASGAKYTWEFKGPEANLYDRDGRQVGTHFAGPSWKLEDGSTITAEVVDKAGAPRGLGIPWLLLKVASHSGRGALDAVAFVRRADTKGGLPPRASCDAAQAGAVARMHYTATYQFFAAAQ